MLSHDREKCFDKDRRDYIIKHLAESKQCFLLESILFCPKTEIPAGLLHGGLSAHSSGRILQAHGLAGAAGLSGLTAHQ